MAKAMNDTFADKALDTLKTGSGVFGPCTRMVACSAQPTTYTEGNATYALADATMTGTDFTIADGTTNGRKVTMGAKSTITVDTTGTATHVCLLDVTNVTLMYVTTCTSQALTAANTVNFPAWVIEIADPT